MQEIGQIAVVLRILFPLVNFLNLSLENLKLENLKLENLYLVFCDILCKG